MATPAVLALSGGVGGARLCTGLADILPPEALHIACNVADDFRHLGLTICPDIDTVLYNLSGRNDPAQGWGVAGESWQVLEALAELDAPTWFRLGDRDLATHLFRAGRLADGASLSTVTAELAERLGIGARLYPVTEQPLATRVDTDDGELPFQEYFVRRQCQPRVRGFRFAGLEAARLQPQLAALARPRALDAVIICPSNPFVSVDPILLVEDFWQRLRDTGAPVAAISPIIGGRAVKGPAGKMLAELNLPVTALGVAQWYATRYPGLVSVFVLDEEDAALAAEVENLGMRALVVPTWMRSREDKQVLARACLDGLR
ncbi:2-phospho-L-lactate transferase [Haliea atlantica]